MGIGDIFKTGQFKAEIESLKQENFRLQSELDHAQSLFTPEMQNAQSLHNLINKLNSDKSVLESNLEELARDISGAGSIWIAADNRQKDRQGALPGQAKKRAHQRL